MENRYRVPTLERVNRILQLIISEKSGVRQIDFSKKLGISKSTTFSLLKTLEGLGWIVKDKDETYNLGPELGIIGSHYFKHINIVNQFYEIGPKYVELIDEHLQIGKLENDKVMYLGKIMSSSPIDLVTYPGSLFPSHSTSVGKVQLINKSFKELESIFKDGLIKVTEYTITDLEELFNNLSEAKQVGYIEEHQESAIGIHCIAAPIYNMNGEIIAGVSIAMTLDKWDKKKDIAREVILKFSRELSYLNGYPL
ncbi:transcriptional regulator [Bacillus sp. OxB-1]|uniref:IclR family transcriptional regulator n=1 Tax=Bacillus sp. (strain OxB-1) TaxID=98228 RepID=UPI000581C343|nr:IclR family transcriptional regulator [Bacillus sp. OxB-1]BAQ09339.1 transcriptional regulator [Bacillus sp. OxB-1]